MRVGWVVVAMLLLNASVAGCFGAKKKDDGSHDLVLAASLPVLTIKVKVGNDTFSYSSAPAVKVGNATGNKTGNGTANATTTASSSSSSAGNATGNSTGNATGNSTNNNTATPAAAPTSPTGLAPLNVTFTLGILNATGAVNWTFNTGDVATAAKSAGTAGNGTAGNGTGNSTSASNSTAPSSNATGNATGNSTPASTSAVLSGVANNATYSHSYALAGNYTATFTVTLANATKLVLTAPITVLAPVIENATNATSNATSFGPPPDPITITGTISGIAGSPSHTKKTFDVAVPVHTMTIALSYSDPGGQGIIDLDWHITGPSGEKADGTNSGPEDPAVFDLPGLGTWTIDLVPYTAANTSYTITVTFA